MYIYPGEINRKSPREACCSSETMRFRTRSCQFALNCANHVIERTISDRSAFEREIATKEVRNYAH